MQDGGKRMRIAAGAIAVTGALALATQPFVGYEMLPILTGEQPSWGRVLWLMTGFFTILTHLVCVWVMTGMARGRREADGTALGALTLALLVVMIVYHALLARLWQPWGYGQVADIFLHSLLPIAVFGFWLVWAPKRAYTPRTLLQWLIWPAAYAAYALARGLAFGDYPYPVLDIGTLGPGAVARNILAISLLFVGLACLLYGLSRLLPERWR